MNVRGVHAWLSKSLDRFQCVDHPRSQSGHLKVSNENGARIYRGVTVYMSAEALWEWGSVRGVHAATQPPTGNGMGNK